MPAFSTALIAWQKQHGRHDLPWQNTTDAYRIWVSEIMLQQTQVAAVKNYYLRFLQRFPQVQSLADAPLEEVLALWSGLGYYSRARNLHRAAKIVVQQYGGRFPEDPVLIEQLPGIGRSTAAAIAVFAYGVKAAILDGNVKRVLSRIHAIEGYPASPAIQKQLWILAESLLPNKQIQAYTQGLMDLGATICVRINPKCLLCPLHSACQAYLQGRVSHFPTPKPPRSLPVRYATVWIIQTGQGVWLESRPPTGIWGGLLSLPQTEGHWQPGQALPELASLPGQVVDPQLLPRFSHTFTHFKLQIQPVLASLQQPLTVKVAEALGRFMLPEEIATAPLPAPVKKLLLALLVTDRL